MSAALSYIHPPASSSSSATAWRVCSGRSTVVGPGAQVVDARERRRRTDDGTGERGQTNWLMVNDDDNTADKAADGERTTSWLTWARERAVDDDDGGDDWKEDELRVGEPHTVSPAARHHHHLVAAAARYYHHLTTASRFTRSSRTTVARRTARMA
ncbi:hypothetical protein OsJ_06302 [Oryza sativa Japonica Group]|nr:hypothetical protein OsJ_06302 [Oryza sativa Japonica Group]